MNNSEWVGIKKAADIKDISPALFRYYVKKGYTPPATIIMERMAWPIDIIREWPLPVLKIGRKPKGVTNDKE